MSAAPTPTPWKITSVMVGHKGDIYAPTPGAKMITDCHHIARCFAPKPEKAPACDLQAIAMTRDAVAQIEANAALIVSAVNSHEALLELAHQYASDLRHPPTADSRERRLERIAAVLAKAGAA